MPTSWQSRVKRRARSMPHALFDVFQNFGVAALVADYEQAQPAILHDLERFVVDVGARVGRPGDPERLEQLRDFACAHRIGGEGIVVKEQFLHFRELRLHRGDFFVHVLGTAHAVFMPLGHLRPQAEGAARRASAPGVHRNVGIMAVGTVVAQVVEVLFVDFGYERQLSRSSLVRIGRSGIVLDQSIAAIADAADLVPVHPLGHLDHRVVELFACCDIDGFGQLQRLLRRGRSDVRRPSRSRNRDWRP